MPVAWERHIRIVFGMQDTSDEAKQQYGDSGQTTFQQTEEYYYPAGKNRYIEFDCTSTKDADNDAGTVRIWNFQEETLKRIYDVLTAAGLDSEAEECDAGKVPWLDIYAGYGEWCPLVFTGKIKGLPTTEHDGADVVTTFNVTDDAHNFLKDKRSDATFPPGTMHSEIVLSLLDELGLPLGVPAELGTDFPSKNGLTLGPDTSIREALDREAQDTNSTFWVRNSHSYFVPIAYGKEVGVTLNQRTGLIFGPRPVHRPQWGGNDDLEFVSLMNPLLEVDTVVTIDSEGFKGKVKLTEVNYVANEHDFYCNCKASLEDETEREEDREKKTQEVVAALGGESAVVANGNVVATKPAPVGARR